MSEAVLPENVSHLGGVAGVAHGAGVTVEEWAKDAFFNFLNTWGAPTAADGSQGDEQEPLYVTKVLELAMAQVYSLHVDWSHFNEHNSEIASLVAEGYYRFEPSLRKALQNFVRVIAPEHVKDEESGEREFWLSFYNLPTMDKLRDLRVNKVGTLTCFSGTVTRTSDVRPELYLGTFRCLECASLVRGVEQQFAYTEPLICSNRTCGNRKSWSLVREESVFVDWQRIKVQEHPDEVPAGSLPRGMDVIVRNQVDLVKAGDKVVFTGTLVVVPDVGSMRLGGATAMRSGGPKNGGGADGFTTKAFGSREMTYRLMFVACSTLAADTRSGMVNVRSEEDESPEEVLSAFGAEHQREVMTMREDPQVYMKLTQSICPSVWGHDSIKQAVLLMLFGGVHKRTKEGIALRGDINVIIIGDPSCAKSQILKYVASFLPRAVYTSGKASTAAGLTASVVKEPENGEFAIEAGALMLADNGICCIDEFDKMDVKDQVAIHEAMEQQTISITKAGIQATLNARASILAAANPAGGRYDKAKPLKYNVNLPPALLSRFDLMHVMIDETSEMTDTRIAQHIIRLHRFQGAAFANVPYSTEQMQRYIKYARAIKPQMTSDAAHRLVHAYKELRAEDMAPGSSSSYRITVRQLEALVRLSEALARAYCSPDIQPRHVDEAKRLLKASVLKIEQSDVELDQGMEGMDLVGTVDEVRNVQPEDIVEDDAEMADERARGKENNGALGNGGGAGAATAAAAAAAKGGAGPEVRKGTEGGDEGRAHAPGPVVKKTVKITAQKFQYMKNLLVKRVLDSQEAYDARMRQLAAEEENGVAPLLDEEDVGIQQGELMQWFLSQQQAKGLVKTVEDAEAEMELLFKVITHLLRKDTVFVACTVPIQGTQESNSSFATRLQTERSLRLHADYSPDV